MSNKNQEKNLIAVRKDELKKKEAIEMVERQNNVITELSKNIQSNSEIIVRGKDNIKSIRKYKFREKIGSRESFEVSDEKAISAIDAITTVNAITERGDLLICYELYQLSELKTFEGTDIDLSKFAQAMWGIDKKTVSQYIRIGKIFIEKDEKGYRLKDEIPQSLKKSQLLEFLAYIGKKVVEIVDGEAVESEITLDDISQLYADGILKDGMTAKTIRSTLKSKYKPEKEKEESKEDKLKKKVSKLETKEKKFEYADNVISELQTIFDDILVNGMIEDNDKIANIQNSINYIKSIITDELVPLNWWWNILINLYVNRKIKKGNE